MCVGFFEFIDCTIDSRVQLVGITPQLFTYSECQFYRLENGKSFLSHCYDLLKAKLSAVRLSGIYQLGSASARLISPADRPHSGAAVAVVTRHIRPPVPATKRSVAKLFRLLLAKTVRTCRQIALSKTI